MIYIIIVGRNDNYGGDFEARLFATSRYNLDELEKRGIDYELIFVEWNPTPDRPLLSHKVIAAFEQARCIVVDTAVHRHISQNRYIAVFEYHAKNAGARRARGDWLLLTNPDNFFGEDILRVLEQDAFEPDTLYRAGRIRINDASYIDDPELSNPTANDPPPYCAASGDFMLCSKALFDRIGGFREDLAFTNTHKDSVLCHAALDLTAQVRKIGNTYHLRHPKDDVERRRLDYDWLKVDRRPQAEYGLSEDFVAESTAAGITSVTLKAPLLQAAMDRVRPKPRVPRKYRRHGRWHKLLGQLLQRPDDGAG